jgi:hypothetical protein
VSGADDRQVKLWRYNGEPRCSAAGRGQGQEGPVARGASCRRDQLQAAGAQQLGVAAAA